MTRLILLSLLLLLLLLWPLSCRYTSFGIDLEDAIPNSDQVRCTFYRLRWPGDGSVVAGRIVESRAADAKPFESFDLGGRFFHPAREVRPQSIWNRLGFWCITSPDSPAAQAPGMAPRAQIAFLIGVPHWLPILIVLVLIFAFRKRRSGANPADPR